MTTLKIVEVVLDAVGKLAQLAAAITAFILVVVAGPRELKKWR